MEKVYDTYCDGREIQTKMRKDDKVLLFLKRVYYTLGKSRQILHGTDGFRNVDNFLLVRWLYVMNYVLPLYR